MYRACHCKQFLKRTVVLMFYIGCITFVIHRGYKCIAKYLSKPEGVEMSYQFIGDMRFPSFTFCSHNWNKYPPNYYNEEVLNECNYTSFQVYAYEGKYVGNGTTDCTDPKILQQRVGLKYDELDIWNIKITTFDRFLNNLEWKWAAIANDTYFQWTNSYLDQDRGGCHTFSLKENALTHGIMWVRLIISVN